MKLLLCKLHTRMSCPTARLTAVARDSYSVTSTIRVCSIDPLMFMVLLIEISDCLII